MTGQTPYVMPKGGILGKNGKLNKAGHHYVTGIQRAASRQSNPLADTAPKLLAAGPAIALTSGIWQTMDTAVASGAEIFRPDLGDRLDFEFTLTGATVMLFPDSVPEGAYPFFSVEFRQDEVGGRPLSFDASFVGEPIEILDAANDATICGFKVRRNGTYTGWAIKGIEAAL
jgi:hypothetical protein